MMSLRSRSATPWKLPIVVPGTIVPGDEIHPPSASSFQSQDAIDLNAAEYWKPSTDPDHRTSCSSMLACHGFHDPVSQPFAARYNAKVLHRFKSSPAHLGRKVGPN